MVEARIDMKCQAMETGSTGPPEGGGILSEIRIEGAAGLNRRFMGRNKKN
jgi:hypothetical protein